MKTKTNRKPGFTLIETLVAGAILATSVVGLVSFGYVNFQMTSHATNLTAASAAARSEMEQVRLEGFSNAVEGSSTDYYDGNGSYPASASQTSSSVYSAQTTVTTDLVNRSTPAAGALRTVRVTVSLVSSGQVVYQSYSALASGGV